MRALDKIVNFLLLKLSINTYPHIKYIIQNIKLKEEKKLNKQYRKLSRVSFIILYYFRTI